MGTIGEETVGKVGKVDKVGKGRGLLRGWGGTARAAFPPTVLKLADGGEGTWPGGEACPTRALVFDEDTLWSGLKGTGGVSVPALTPL